LIFKDFLGYEKKAGRFIDEERIKYLVENLNNLEQSDLLKIAIIKQAIAGGYSDFRPLPVNRPMTVPEMNEERKH
jgi:hypothetical protein